MDADANRAPADLPKDEAGRSGRAPVNFQPGVSEATASAMNTLTEKITASEAGKHNACDVRARQTDLTEEETRQKTDRRATPTEAGQVTVWKSKATKRFSAA